MSVVNASLQRQLNEEMYLKCSDLRFCIPQIQRPTKNNEFQNFPQKKYFSFGIKLLAYYIMAHMTVYIFI